MGTSTVNNKVPEDTELLELWNYMTHVRKDLSELKAELAYLKGLILNHANSVKAHYEGQGLVK